jgi:molybdate ABC transporter permease protein
LRGHNFERFTTFMIPDLAPLWISLKTALLATFITFFLGIAAAYGMVGWRSKMKPLIEGLLVSPLILPPTVIGFALLLLLGKNGPIGKLFNSLNFSLVFTWYGAVCAAIIVAFPLMYKTTLGAFEQIDPHLLGVARSLGASEIRVFRRVLLPLALPGILAGTTLAFARALGEFGATLMLAGNIPGETQTIPMAIYFAVESGAIAEAWFWAIVILAISLSGITLVHVWQHDHSRGSHADHLSFKPLNPVKTHQGLGAIPWGSSNLDSSNLDSSNLDSSNLDSSKLSAIALTVKLQKTLPGFELNVAFESGDLPWGILGGSGAGKSMILRCLAGLETPDRGQIILNGRTLFDSDRGINLPSRDRNIGFLVQNYALFPHLTVAENIAFSWPPSTSRARAQQQVATHLQAMQLTGLGDRYPQQLSGGQQQRVALARALASQPEMLLLDEPFSALDTHLRSQMEQEMSQQLAQFAGVSLLVTHNLEEAYRICERLLVLDQGQAIAQGTKQAIFEQPPTYRVAQLTGCKNFSRAIAIDAHHICAIDWNLSLWVDALIPERFQFVGLRAHQIHFPIGRTLEHNWNNETFLPEPSHPEKNIFPCWVAAVSETPHRVTLFLNLQTAPTDRQDYHLQAEVFKEKWQILRDRPFPWQVQLLPPRLMLLE